MTIDINCDLGESFGRYSVGNDLEIMPYISSCNIACGFHGGDPRVIIETIKNAYHHKLKIGAHPSYPDLQGFGRRRMEIPSDELIPILQYQIAVIDKLSNIYADGLHHVKPHGALYNHSFDNEDVAQAIVSAMAPWKDQTFLYAQYGSTLASVAEQKGLKVMLEGFADRKYSKNLNLMSRQKTGAVHSQIGTMVDQVVEMVKHKKIKFDNSSKSIRVETICIHGDHPDAVEIAKIISTALQNEGISIH